MMEQKSLRRWWIILAAGHLLLLFHLGAYIFFSGNGQSLSFRLLALGITGFSVAFMALAAWITPQRAAGASRRFRRWQWPVVTVVLAAMLAFGAEMRPEWIYPHIGLMVAGSFSLLFWTLSESEKKSVSLALWVGLGVIALAVVAIRVEALGASPPIDYSDEGWSFGWAYSVAKTGKLSDWIFLGGEDFEGKTYYYLPHFYVPYGGWVKLVGPGLWQARLYTFGLMLITMGLAAWAAYRLYGATAARFTAAILLASAVLELGARTRHDIGLALAMMASLVAYSEALHRKRDALHLLAGACMGWGMFAHYNASLLGVMLTLALYLPRYVRQRRLWPERGLWLFVLGGVLAGLSVAAFQIFPDVDMFLRSRKPRTPHSVSDYISALGKHLNFLARSQYEFLLMLLGVGAALFRRRASDCSLLIVAFCGPLVMAFLVRSPFDYLEEPLIPFYAILIAAAFSETLAGLKWGERRLPAQYLIVIFALFWMPGLGTTLHVPLPHLLKGEPILPEPPPGVAWTLEHIAPGATVSGEHHHFFWLTDYRFVSPRTATHLTPDEKKKYASTEAVWDTIDVDVFILDPSVGTFGILRNLQNAGYFESRGYRLAAEFSYQGATMQVYVSPDAPLRPD
ncbi:MAG: glycosyltransferase family 39 protein [Chloroflexi bacterium]|nr:glycosyltransferase family 39 protein [Chloroflexota bacterium]